MPNYKMLIEYDGGRFAGWQIQPNIRTVQGDLEEAIFVATRERVRLHCAGRTDRGVHAMEQVANFKTVQPIEPDKLRAAVNGITQSDIVVHEIAPAADTFHARFDAKARQYIYFISLAPLAIGRQYAYYCKFPLQIEAMKKAAEHLYGEHHFEAFSQKVPGERHYLSRVELIEWQVEDTRLSFRIRANRFLHHMVRLLVGTLIQVGREKITPDEFKTILEARTRDHPGFKAPAHGLFLEKIFY
ncbi:MAG: tRNA pseudouridine(38-40) synthase TruA [Calditrichaeota bacterium]|nr:MAG: tRNA pseudouridine(38-40) synthase TruA [Calditrichota bacterium]